MDDLQLVPGSKITFTRDSLYNPDRGSRYNYDRDGGFEICLKSPCRAVPPRAHARRTQLAPDARSMVLPRAQGSGAKTNRLAS